jgi:hypothetical protein
MYILTFYRDKSDWRRVAATPSPTDDILPEGDWEEIFNQPVFPEIAGSDLNKIQAGIAKDGYFIYQLSSARH